MKIKKTILILIALVSTALMLIGLAGCGGSASAPSVSSAPTHWAKSYGGNEGDRAYSIQQTNEGGFIVAGYTDSFGAGDGDFWVIKLDSSGSILWQKTYGGTGIDVAHSIQQTSDGGYIVAGGGGNSDFWVIKLDSSGSILWQKTYGGTGIDVAHSIQQTSDGGYIVAGETISFGAGFYDFWLIKLDSDGDITWQKTYGGTDNDTAYSVQQTSDGGYIVAGYIQYLSGNYYHDFWLIKLDSNGDITWQKTYGGANGDHLAYSVRQTSDGGYIVAGANWSYGSESAFGVIKLDSSGNISWQKKYLIGRGLSYSVQQTSDGGYIVAGGVFTGDFVIWIIKLDSDGDIIWQKTYGDSGFDGARYIQQTSDGGYIVAGNTDGAGNDDFWVLRLKSDGTISPTAPSYIGADTSATVQDTSVIPSDTSVIPIDSTATVTDTTVIGVDTNATVETQASD